MGEPGEMECPNCGAVAHFDTVDNGIAEMQCGPAVCQSCGWIEDQPDFLCDEDSAQ